MIFDDCDHDSYDAHCPACVEKVARASFVFDHRSENAIKTIVAKQQDTGTHIDMFPPGTREKDDERVIRYIEENLKCPQE